MHSVQDGAMALVGANDKLPQICKSQRQLRNEMHALTRWLYYMIYICIHTAGNMINSLIVFADAATET